jgi:hypothetical protein
MPDIRYLLSISRVHPLREQHDTDGDHRDSGRACDTTGDSGPGAKDGSGQYRDSQVDHSAVEDVRHAQDPDLQRKDRCSDP